MKKNILNWMTIALMAFAVCAGFAACGSDDDDDNGGGSSAPVPAGLIGTWEKTEGAPKHYMSFTFNADGTGTGRSSHISIYWVDTWSFKYVYKSNGNVECDAVRVHADEDEEFSGSQKLIFRYDGSKLKAVDLVRADWANAVFEKD